jgi:hypothetical protein
MGHLQSSRVLKVTRDYYIVDSAWHRVVVPPGRTGREATHRHGGAVRNLKPELTISLVRG